MKKTVTSVARLVALVCLIIANAATNTSKASNNTTDNDSVNRAVAVVMAANLNEVLNQLTTSKVPVNQAEVGRYIAMALNGQDLGMARTDATAYIDKIIIESRPQLPDSMDIAAENAYIAQAAAQPAAITTPSGLVFIVLTEGEGPSPKLNDKVRVNYRGQLSNGLVFDDTLGEGVTFDVAQVIPGYSEGLQMMKPGGTYRLVIPAHLGYGPEGIRGIIPPNATLDFTVTLDSIIPAN